MFNAIVALAAAFALLTASFALLASFLHVRLRKERENALRMKRILNGIYGKFSATLRAEP
jgi:hypothetical protein